MTRDSEKPVTSSDQASETQRSGDEDLLIVELDARLELGIPFITDLDDDYNTVGCTNSSACSKGSNGANCTNTAHCS